MLAQFAGPQDSLVTMITGECDANPLNMSPGRPRHIDTQLSPSVSEPGHRPHSPHIPDPTWLALNYFKWQHELFVPQSILSTEYTFLIKGFLICFTAFDKRIKILKLVFQEPHPVECDQSVKCEECSLSKIERFPSK